MTPVFRGYMHKQRAVMGEAKHPLGVGQTAGDPHEAHSAELKDATFGRSLSEMCSCVSVSQQKDDGFNKLRLLEFVQLACCVGCA